MIPENIKKHRPPGCEIKFIGGHYYVYKATSKWDKVTKRPKKISGQLLGKIVPEEGFIPSGKATLKKAIETPPAVREFGAYALCLHLLRNELPLLKAVFPQYYWEIFLMSYLRLAYHAKITMMPTYATNSFIKVEHSIPIGEKHLSHVLHSLGERRTEILDFKKHLLTGKEYLLIDSTSVFSESSGLGINQHGYNKQRSFRKQVNLLFIVSSVLQMPVYYRILPGNIRDVKALHSSLLEAQIPDAVIIADKGFYSKNNVSVLEEYGLQFIIPLKRDNSLIPYKFLRYKAKENSTQGWFMYNQRPIWYKLKMIGEQLLCLYFDQRNKAQEEEDYLNRITSHPETYSMSEFREKELTFGTIAILHNLKNKSPEEIYQLYKTRSKVEQVFDSFKNTLNADASHMRNQRGVEGWMFINFLAIRMYYSLLNDLREHKLLKHYSPDDILQISRQFKKLFIANKWIPSEIVQKHANLLSLWKIPIT